MFFLISNTFNMIRHTHINASSLENPHDPSITQRSSTPGTMDNLLHSIDPTNSDDERSQRGSRKTQSELLSVLPHQSFSESGGILSLTFSLPSDAPQSSGGATEGPRQVSIQLVVDAAPGCGGIAWPAGQVPSLTLPFFDRSC